MMNEKKTVLVTGATGFIGSHAVVELLSAGYSVVGFDNFSNSDETVLDKISEICKKTIKFYKGDMCDEYLLDQIFFENRIDSVIHFAGYKAVGESVAKPLMYFENNVGGTIKLLKAMSQYGVSRIVFSSSATVYGLAKTMPVNEDAPLGVSNPYGRTKLIIEKMLCDICESDENFKAVLLRYFNPIGAHDSGLIGENPKGIPNNLMPFINKVALGELPKLNIFGGDYPTLDGTGVRDYIHVIDLAKGHIKALERMEKAAENLNIYNLGTGTGHSVLQVVHAFEKATGQSVPYEIVERRPGDVAELYADSSKAERELGWKALYGIEKMCKDSYRAALNR